MARVKANGLEFEYDSFGRETDPAILLIMGFAAQMTMWPVALCEGLAALGFRVIRFDNRDIGKSSHMLEAGTPNIAAAVAKMMARQMVEGAPYQLDDMAADAVGILDALGIERAHIVGASMGGMIAQIVAARYPQRARSLTSIMSTTARRGLARAKPEAMAALSTPPASSSREDRIAQGMRAWRIIGSPGFAATDAELRASIEREVDRAPYEPTGLARQMMAIITAQPRNELLKNVRCPTLVIHGADDPLIPMDGGRDTAESIEGARLVIVPGMAHDFTDALVPVYLKNIGDFVTSVEAKKAA
jgi:pimeloyl-ACP methyl ester carboxylesterase